VLIRSTPFPPVCAAHRIVFTTLHKYDGVETRPLSASEIKQIAGRAGRYASGHAEGYVNVLNSEDLPLLREALATATPHVTQACLLPRCGLCTTPLRIAAACGQSCCRGYVSCSCCIGLGLWPASCLPLWLLNALNPPVAPSFILLVSAVCCQQV
jgi:hypothetical protein